MTHEEMTPRDDAEAVALFRAQVVGELVARSLERGSCAPRCARSRSKTFDHRRAW